MKKIIASATVLLITLSLSACSSNAAPNDDSESRASEAAVEAPTKKAIPKSVVYKVTGSAAEADKISYMTLTEGDMKTEQVNNAKLPFAERVDVKGTGTFGASSYSVTAETSAPGGDIICEILVDGKVIAEDSDTGTEAVVTCTGY